MTGDRRQSFVLVLVLGLRRVSGSATEGRAAARSERVCMPEQETMRFAADYHTHTEHSYCCEDITTHRLARSAGEWQHLIAITDHSAHVVFPPEARGRFDSDDAPAILEANRDAGRDRVRRYLDRVRALGDGFLAGTELDILPDGRPLLPEELLPTLDVVIGAIHALAADRRGLPEEEVLAEWRFQSVALMQLDVHVLGHPFRYLVHRRIPVAPEDVEWLVEQAGAHGVALELNSHYLCRELDHLMVAACLRRGVRIAIATDAHRWQELGDFGYHRRVFAGFGITEAGVLDTVLFDHRRG